jgi:hypothetical protein
LRVLFDLAPFSQHLFSLDALAYHSSLSLHACINDNSSSRCFDCVGGRRP